MTISKADRHIVRELARQVSQIAALPIQEEKRRLWRALNGLKPQRPMVMVDQVCWNEMETGDELTLLCEDPECRGYETMLRRGLYQWRHFPVDRVVEPFIRVPKAVQGIDYGIQTMADRLKLVETSEVVSRHFINQIRSMEDLEKIRMPVISHDETETNRRMEVAGELFGGILEPREWGYDPYLSIWDPISRWMGVENVLFALVDQPDMMHALAGKLSDWYMALLDQLEAQGLLCCGQSLIHCTGAYTDELPAPGFDCEKPRTKDIWMFGLAQMFSTASPAMFEEYEIGYSLPLFQRFGLVYYGCCDPLDGKMAEVKKIPNLRKISMSPWANQRRGAEQIGKEYVFSRKPNPSYLAMTSFDEALVRADLIETKRICAEYGCPLELIIKDISTVRNEPERLWRLARIAMEVAEG